MPAPRAMPAKTTVTQAAVRLRGFGGVAAAMLDTVLLSDAVAAQVRSGDPRCGPTRTVRIEVTCLVMVSIAACGLRR